MCNDIPVFTIADFGESGNSDQHILIIFIDMASTYILHYQLQTPSVRTWFYVNKIILEARKAKIDWLQARLA